jgi:hypothetical protein
MKRRKKVTSVLLACETRGSVVRSSMHSDYMLCDTYLRTPGNKKTIKETDEGYGKNGVKE